MLKIHFSSWTGKEYRQVRPTSRLETFALRITPDIRPSNHENAVWDSARWVPTPSLFSSLSGSDSEPSLPSLPSVGRFDNVFCNLLALKHRPKNTRFLTACNPSSSARS